MHVGLNDTWQFDQYVVKLIDYEKGITTFIKEDVGHAKSGHEASNNNDSVHIRLAYCIVCEGFHVWSLISTSKQVAARQMCNQG